MTILETKKQAANFCVVIGTPEAIGLAVKRLGPGSTHMRRIRSKKRRNEIFSKLCFGENAVTALCIRSDIDLVVGRVRKKSRRQNSTKQIMDAYDHHLYQYILKNTAMFFAKHGCDAHEVVFQCDSDCVNFTKANNLTRGRQGDAYRLADTVAWFNNRNEELAGVTAADLRSMLNDELVRRFT